MFRAQDNGLFLSMIVPVYNKEKYLADALDSFVSQDIEDYEIICVDDGSFDSSPEILKEYAAKYPNIRIITKKNGGLSAARNTGLRAATGEYVCFFDPDDFIANNCLGKLKRTARDTGADRVRLATHIFYHEQYPTPKDLFGKVSEFDRIYSDWNVNTCIIKRSVLVDHTLEFCEPLRAYGEDTLFMYEFKKCTASCVDFPETVYFHRINSDSIMGSSSKNKLQKINSLTYIVKHIKADYDDFDDTYCFKIDHTAYMLTDILRMLMGDIASLPERSERRSCIRELKESGLYPFHEPPEYPKTKEEYVRGKYGRSQLEKKLYYYSTERCGYLFMSNVYYPVLRSRHKAGAFLKRFRKG